MEKGQHHTRSVVVAFWLLGFAIVFISCANVQHQVRFNKDNSNKLVGMALVKRDVVAGGLYTLGAWKTIFRDVAADVAVDLKNQVERSRS